MNDPNRRPGEWLLNGIEYSLRFIGRSVIKPAWDSLGKPAPQMSRRTAIGFVIASVAAGALGAHVVPRLMDNSPSPQPEAAQNPIGPGKQSDILVETDKFTSHVSRFHQLAKETASHSDRQVPYEVFLAVSMHESDSGTSELAKNANNFFGVIAKDGWTGAVYEKRTEEQIPVAEFAAYTKQYPSLKLLRDNGNGTLRVEIMRPFRKYNSPEASFDDFAEKIYYRNADGTYRYDDVVRYLKSGGRDPYTVISLLSDNDEPDELRYATGDEWRSKVPTYVQIIQGLTGEKSSPAAPNIPLPSPATLPEKQGTVKNQNIDYSMFTTEADKTIATTMQTAFDKLTKANYLQFVQTGIKDQSQLTSTLTGKNYSSWYGAAMNPEDISYLILHLWANGVENGGIQGNSHRSTLTDQINSWANNSHASVQFLLSDNETRDLWQLTKSPFGKTSHVGERKGIQDIGRETHPDARDSNSIGIEVQADAINDVSAKQFETLIYWSTKLLFELGKLKEGMSRETVNRVVENTVVGHGKNGGREFGNERYMKPFIAALQQFAFIAVNG